MKKFILTTLVTIGALAAGCDDGADAPAASGTTGARAGSNASTPAGTGTAAMTQPAAAGHHNRIPLGETTVGGLKLIATMDAPIRAAGGGDGAFDVVITGGKPKAVRFWVGTQDAAGSVKARAEEETTDNWHTHVEVPDPLPASSKFWVEVEPSTGEMFVVSFDVKTQ